MTPLPIALRAALPIGAALLLIGAYAYGRSDGRRLAEGPAIAAIERVKAAALATADAVRTKTAAAHAADLARARAAEQRAAVINQEISNDYQAHLADARARYDRLLANAAARPATGGGAGSGLPGLPGASGRPDAAAAQDRFLAADALTATDQALQLDALIRWVDAQIAAAKEDGR